MDAVLQRQLGAALAASVCVGLAVCALRGRSESASADDGGKREESAVRKTADGPRGHAAEPTAVGKPSPIEPADVCPGVGTFPPTPAPADADSSQTEAAHAAIPPSPAHSIADAGETKTAEADHSPLVNTRPALIVSPTAEAEADAEAAAEATAAVLSGGAMIPDSVRTVDLFDDEVESQQAYQHGTPAPIEHAAEAPSQPDTLGDLVLPPYKQAMGIYQPNSVVPSLDTSVSSMNDSSFTAGAKQSFLDGIISGSDDEDEQPSLQPPESQTEVADKEDTQDTVAPSPGAADASFEWPPSNGWGTPDPPSAEKSARPHVGGGTPKPLGDNSCTDNVKEILYQRGAAIDAAVEASAAGKFRNVAEVLASSTTQGDFQRVLAAVQEQQRAKALELKRRELTLQVMQHKKEARQKHQEQVPDQFQTHLASMLSAARNNAKRSAETGIAFRDLPEFPDEESDDDEYRPTAAELAAHSADAELNRLEGTVPEAPARSAPVIQTKPTSTTGKRANKKKARSQRPQKAAAAAPAAGKENRVTLTTSTGKSVTTEKRATRQGRRVRARNQQKS